MCREWRSPWDGDTAEPESLHERYFERFGRALSALVEQLLQGRGRMDEHGQRLLVLERA